MKYSESIDALRARVVNPNSWYVPSSMDRNVFSLSFQGGYYAAAGITTTVAITDLAVAGYRGVSGLTRNAGRISSAENLALAIKGTSFNVPKGGMRQSYDLNALSRAGQVLDRGGLTKAGRALDKHGGRLGSVFPKATGNSALKNSQGQFHLDDILTNPGGYSKQNNFGGIDFRRNNDGAGVRFYKDGTFRGFLEPN